MTRELLRKLPEDSDDIGAAIGEVLSEIIGMDLLANTQPGARLKRLLADATLDNVALKDLLGKKW